MKLVRYLDDGKAALGLLVDGGLIALSRHDPALYDVDDAVTPAGWDRLERLATRRADVDANDVAFLPPLARPARIFCVGVNYRAHAEETGAELPPHPTLFMRTHASLVGHGQTLRHPGISTHFDYEGELAVVIGSPCFRVDAADALSFVGGYTCCNEGSVRDFQKHSATGMTGKNFDASGALGPWVVPATDIPDPAALTLRTRLNGEEVQHASTNQLIYDVPTIISYLSSCLTLLPGDVIATGTPSGVGSRRKPPRWLAPGDQVEVEISGVGVLRNVVQAAQRAQDRNATR